MTVPCGEPRTDHSEWHEMRAALSEALGQLAMRGGYGVGVLASERLAADLLPVVRKIAADELRAVADELTDRTRTWIPNLLRDRADDLDSER